MGREKTTRHASADPTNIGYWVAYESIKLAFCWDGLDLRGEKGGFSRPARTPSGGSQNQNLLERQIFRRSRALLFPQVDCSTRRLFCGVETARLQLPASLFCIGTEG